MSAASGRARRPALPYLLLGGALLIWGASSLPAAAQEAGVCRRPTTPAWILPAAAEFVPADVPGQNDAGLNTGNDDRDAQLSI